MDKTRESVLSALTYPAFVIVVAIVVISIIMGYAVPTFLNMFDSMSIELPWVTRALIAVSGFFQRYALVLLGLLALDRGFLLRLVLLLPILLSALGLASAGALLGGVLLGMIEIFASAYISTQLSNAIVFAVLIVVLLVRPTGLLGKQVREKV